jgi:uncharacterized iron-regulated protein
MKITLALVLSCLTGCSVTSTTTDGPKNETPAVDDGKTYATPEDAPKYDGAAFAGMQILDLDTNVYLDEKSLVKAIEEAKIVFFGEQHETAPVQELELWLLERFTAKHADAALAMEHFQRDEQPVIDKYLADEISEADFNKQAQLWRNYATYWKPLVEHMKEKQRPVVALNVPKEALDGVYAKYPEKPTAVFNSWGASFKYDKQIAPRPLPAYDDAFKAYFASSYDHSVHGEKMGMSYDEALVYFTELAHIRDETMAYFASQTEGHVFVVAGDWHVQTGLATPDRVLRYASGTRIELVTTTPKSKLAEVKSKTVSGRKLARYVLVYE